MFKHIHAVIVGNPNSGKTTLFNALTGSRQIVGNWPGVTVEHKEGICRVDDNEIEIVDLPGIYSFNAHSEDQRVSRDYLVSGSANLIIDVLDATNIERNLYLTSQLRELGLPMIVVLNMWDLAKKRGIEVDVQGLSKSLGCPVIPVTSVHKKDVDAFKKMLGEFDPEIPGIAHLSIPKIPEFQSAYQTLCAQLGDKPFTGTSGNAKLDPKWVALKCLEGDEGLFELLHVETRIALQEFQGIQESFVQETPEILIAETRYQEIHEWVGAHVKTKQVEDPYTYKIDRILLNRFLGIPIFLMMMYFVFWFTINVGGAFIDFFDLLLGAIFVDGVHVLLDSINAPAVVAVIFADGVGGGIQSLSTFIPVLFAMFLMLSILEDSGYMARAAFIMDRFMKVLGLPGKAFVPLIVGFGCSVPAFMGTRTLEQRKDRIMTSMMVPFMSCGAKMPVYALFAVAFFPDAGQNIIFLLYFVGILVAVGTGLLLKHTLLRGEVSRLVMELPSYHVPRPRSIVFQAWIRLRDFIINGGRVLVPIMAILGVLNSTSIDGKFGHISENESVLAAMGKAVTPVFEPFGVEEENWQASVSLFTGFFAKEVIVGTLSGLYAQSNAQENALEAPEPEAPWSLKNAATEAIATIPGNLVGAFSGILDPIGLGGATEDARGQESTFAAMRAGFTTGPWGAFAFLLFVLLYVPCMAATATAAKELGWGITILMVCYSTALAWIMATLVYQISAGHQTLWIATALGILFAMISGLRIYSRK